MKNFFFYSSTVDRIKVLTKMSWKSTALREFKGYVVLLLLSSEVVNSGSIPTLTLVRSVESVVDEKFDFNQIET